MSDLVPVQVSVPKPLQDVMIALQNLVIAIKAGKSPAEIIAMELPVLMALFPELSQLGPDFQTELGPSLDCVLLAARQLVFTIVGK